MKAPLFRTFVAGYAVFLLTLACVDQAHAHGINGHVWVNDGALDWMDDCAAATALKHTHLRPIVQIGSAFPDSGYALEPGRKYGEAAHWEPFVQAYVEQFQARYSPPFTGVALEELAFLLGLAGHGMEDEIFDTVFLRLSWEEEGADQDILDPATDFMLIADGHTELKPPIYYPGDFLLDVYARPEMDIDVTEGHFERGMLIVHTVVIGLVGEDRSGMDDIYRYEVPWAAAHYVDRATPGSLEFEKLVVGPYFQALWHRVHGTFEEKDLILATVPSEGYRLASTDPASVKSRITIFFAKGIDGTSVTAGGVRLLAPDGVSVPIELGGTRWGGLDTVGRILQVRPLSALAPNATYTVEIDPGVALIDGTTTKERHVITVYTPCENTVACKAIEPPPEPAMCPEPALEQASAAPAVDETRGCASGGAVVPVAMWGMAGVWWWRRSVAFLRS